MYYDLHIWFLIGSVIHFIIVLENALGASAVLDRVRLKCVR